MSIEIVYNWIEKLKSQYSNRDCVGWTPLLCIKYGSRLWTPPDIYTYTRDQTQQLTTSRKLQMSQLKLLSSRSVRDGLTIPGIL